MSEIVVASQDAAVVLDGIPHVIQAGVTMARDTHPIVTENPELWKPPDVHYDAGEPAAKTPARAAAAKKQAS